MTIRGGLLATRATENPSVVGAPAYTEMARKTRDNSWHRQS
jgi:hypothetical protein